LQFFCAKGISRTDLKYLIKMEEELYSKYKFSKVIPKKVIGRKHILSATASFQLLPYEILAINQNKCDLIYHQENFINMLNEIAVSEVIPKLEDNYETRVVHYFGTNIEVRENAAERTVVIMFDKKVFEGQISNDWREMEDQLTFSLSKELRIHSGKGPKKSRVNILDENEVIYELEGWLSPAEQNYLEARNPLEVTLKAMLQDVIMKIEQSLLGKIKKFYVDFATSNNHIIVTTFR